jgi:hypothetical protein
MFLQARRVTRASAPALVPLLGVARIALAIFGTLAVGACVAHAQSIDVFADADGTNPCIQAPPGTSIKFYIRFTPGGAATGMTGAELRIVGLPPNPPWFASVLWYGLDVCWIDCDPFGPGVQLGYGACQTTAQNLGEVNGFVFGTLPPMEWIVVGNQVPYAPPFGCPVVTLCDEPTFTRVCVNGGHAYVNWPGACPTVGVESATWSQVRSLYAAP